MMSRLAAAFLALLMVGWWIYFERGPSPSREIVQFTPEARRALLALRSELKFEPDEEPPLNYTGVAAPEEGVEARAAVNGVIDAILARKDGPITAATVSRWIGQGMKRVALLETEDRDRTADYMIEIWYLLGFRGSTGRFSYGSAFQRPDGYEEPLPPGWKSPTEPRPINHR